MPIRFAGVDLLLEDPEGLVRAWLDQHLSELYASIFCLDQTSIREGRLASISNVVPSAASNGGASSSSGYPSSATSTLRRIGLPVGNYPRPPRPKINSLYWPTGSLRWAHGLFLISKANLDAVLSACAGEQSQIFELSAGRERPIAITSSSASSATTSTGTLGIAANLFALAPRPISAAGVSPQERLWLLPLVDARYFWQFRNVRQYAPKTWSEALSQIQGISPTDSPTLGEAVPTGYGRPSAVEFVRDFENAALLVDAVALSVGRRVVGGPAVSRYILQTYKTQSATTAKVAADANLARLTSGWDVVAGGDFSAEVTSLGNIPANVMITFKTAAGDRVAGWSQYDTSGTTHSGSKVFHCSATGGTAPADGRYTTGFERSLADSLGADYYRWLSLHYDLTLAGIVPWEVTGFDDYVRWEIAVHGTGKRRRYQCQTRAVSMPPNFGFDSLPIDPLIFSSSSSSSSSSNSRSSSSSSSSQSSSPSSMPSSSPSSSDSKSSSPYSQSSSSSSGVSSSGSSVSSVSSSTLSTSSSLVSSISSASSSSSRSESSSGSSSTSSIVPSSSFSSTTSSGSISSAQSSTGSSSTRSSSLGSGSPSSSSSSGSTSSGSSGSSSSSGPSSSGSSTISSGSNNQSGSGSNNNNGSSGTSSTTSNPPSSSGTSSASANSSGSRTSSGSGTSSTGSSNSGTGSESSGSGDGCSDVVTDVACTGGSLVVTKVRARIAIC